MSPTCVVARRCASAPVEADWNQDLWQGVEPLALDDWLGSAPPAHRPRTQVKIVYDDASIRWIFRVEDRYVRAAATRHQQAVCKDSCVEFFFVPGPEAERGYFNAEINAAGIMLFHYQPRPKQEVVCLSAADLHAVAVAASLSGPIDPERPAPQVWTAECRVPLSLLERYASVARPDSGMVWLGNFYKCADATSHPHWLAWAPVEQSAFGFHCPEAFGELVFE